MIIFYSVFIKYFIVWLIHNLLYMGNLFNIYVSGYSGLVSEHQNNEKLFSY